MDEEFLANQNEYLEAGIHIATKVKRPGMEKFIYKVREDGLYLLDLKTIDSRIKVASKMISRYDPKDILVIASRIYAITAAEKFSEIINAKFIKKRVAPGIFTDPNKQGFIEPKLVIISDSRNEKQAIKEANTKNIPVIALCDTDNSTKFIDLVIPVNNKGRKALAFTYYLLSREVMRLREEIKSNEEFKYSVYDFEAQLQTDQTDQKHQKPKYETPRQSIKHPIAEQNKNEIVEQKQHSIEKAAKNEIQIEHKSKAKEGEDGKAEPKENQKKQEKDSEKHQTEDNKKEKEAK